MERLFLSTICALLQHRLVIVTIFRFTAMVRKKADSRLRVMHLGVDWLLEQIVSRQIPHAGHVDCKPSDKSPRSNTKHYVL